MGSNHGILLNACLAGYGMTEIGLAMMGTTGSGVKGAAGALLPFYKARVCTS